MKKERRTNFGGAYCCHSPYKIILDLAALVDSLAAQDSPGCKYCNSWRNDFLDFYIEKLENLIEELDIARIQNRWERPLKPFTRVKIVGEE